jgi:hypothetical protein
MGSALSPDRNQGLKRHQLCALTLVPALLLLPLTALYGGAAGGLERALFVLVVLLAMIAVGLLFAPVVHRIAASQLSEETALIRAGVAFLYLAVVLAVFLLVDLLAIQWAGST